MSKTKTIPTVAAKIKVVHDPTTLAKTICPHCGKPNSEVIVESEKGKKLLHACPSCNKDYYIAIPLK